jgi:Major Facilitator Superfamily
MVLASTAGLAALLPILVLARGVLGSLREPALSSTLPSVVSSNELVRANALLAAVWSTTYALGMSAGGFVAGISPSLAIAIDAASFALAAMILLALPRLGPADERAPERLDVRALLRGMKEALDVARAAPALGRAVFQKTPIAFGTGACWVVLVLAAMRSPFAGSAALTIGVLQAIRGVATGIGPIMAERAIAMGARPHRIERAVLALSFVAMIGFALSGSPSAWMICAAAWGLGIGANWVLTTSDIQRLGPKGALGRLSAIDTLSWSLGTSLSAVLVGAFGTHATSAALASIGVGIALDVLLSVRFVAPKELLSRD